jgi:hypothetical protein
MHKLSALFVVQFNEMTAVVCIRVPQTGGNQAGSAGSRSYRSGPVRKMAGNQTLTEPREPGRTEESGLPTGLPGLPPVFFGSANRTGSGLGNPGMHT